MSAPFAGTTTSPLADSHTRAAVHHVDAAPNRAAALPAMKFDVPARAIVTLAGAELALLGVGAGVIYVARKQQAD